MKGGSITKILLDTIFSKAISSTFFNKDLQTVSFLNEFERTYRFTYLQSDSISKIVACGGERYLESENAHHVVLKLEDIYTMSELTLQEF